MSQPEPWPREIDWQARAEAAQARADAAEAQLAALQPPTTALYEPGAGFRLVACAHCGTVLGQLDDNDGIPAPLRDSMQERLLAAHHCDDAVR